MHPAYKWLLFLSLGTSLGGCRGPSLMPPAPLAQTEDPRLRSYDFDGDGGPDYVERLGEDGRVAALRFDSTADPPAPEVLLAPPGTPGTRQLFIALDSVPYNLVRDMWLQGRFRLFYPPVQVISPFPVMTDLCLAEFFGVSPCLGVEASRYTGRGKTTAYLEYFALANSPWLANVDYYIPFTDHASAYLYPAAGLHRELAGIERTVLDSTADAVFTYVLSTSAIGSRYGRDGHVQGLVALDRFCQALMMRTRGRLQITLMSDHGHNLLDSRFLSLHHRLEELGYRDAPTLVSNGDVVVPRYGPVTCAALYTRSPAQAAADTIALEGVELAFFQEGDAIIALGRDGARARIEQRDGRYRYTPGHGDPLALLECIERLRQAGHVDADGFIDDHALFNATLEHVYPDPLRRLWRAFHGLVIRTPDVLLSLEDGYCYGTSFFDYFIDMRAAHGSLRKSSSTAFAMTTAGRLPDAVRMNDLLAAMEALGLKPRD